MIIIGSTALKYHKIPFREPNDLDLTHYAEVEGVDTIVLPRDIINSIPHNGGYATPDALYTLKCSHLGWDIKWYKHSRDMLYLKSIGCTLIPELYNDLVKHWRNTNGNKPYLSLYRTADNFFDNYVSCSIPHDTIHKIISHPNAPMYISCLSNGHSVALDHNKFLALSKDKQVRLFREEITVIAAERWLLNPKCEYSYVKSYSLALKKTIVALTKNWASSFLIENLELFIKPDYSYFSNLYTKGYIPMTRYTGDWTALFDEIITEYNATDPKWRIRCEDYAEVVSEVKLEGTSYEVLDGQAGGEGEGEQCHIVFTWKGVYYKFEYQYYSQLGADFTYALLRRVEPVEKWVTLYE